jgi:tetraacyldisaccharide 4'-kinase
MCYALVTLIRNKAYDWGLLPTYSPPIPTLVVGNLSVGGTGKSPHVDFFASVLSKSYKTAILSRGYGRKSKGFRLVESYDDARNTGDEPLQIKRKFQELTVAVCENRQIGIQTLLKIDPTIQLIILDDALQHRRIKNSFTVLLSLFDKPFFKDFILPSGNLRELANFGKKRADVCIYTKAPDVIEETLKKLYRNNFSQIKPVYFSRIDYGAWIPLSQNSFPETIQHVILVTGIAYPEPLEKILAKLYDVTMLKFPDHHIFETKDIEKIYLKFANFDASKTIIVTTEKDAVKLSNFEQIVAQKRYPWFVSPIKTQIDNSEQLIKQIEHYVETYPRGN